MKKIINSLLFAFVGLLIFASCKKDEHKDFFEGGKAPVLTASSDGPFELSVSAKDQPAVTFFWTNPDYMFTTGVSSQDVFYTIQVSKTGENFTAPNLAEISIPEDLSHAFTVGDLNKALLTAGMVEDVSGQFDIRIKASLLNNTGVLYSNILTFTATPFLDVVYPVPANLYITGAATPAGWQCGCGEPENLAQKFTKVTSSRFELTIHLNGSQSYLFIPVYGSWAAKYGTLGDNNSNDPSGGPFKPNGGDMISPSASGNYKIVVEFKTGKFTVTPA